MKTNLVERGRSLMDPQPHPLLYFLIRMRTVRRMVKCFPAKSLKLIPHQVGSMGTCVIMQKDDSVREHSWAFWLYGASQYLWLPRNERNLSALFCLPPFPMLDEHTLHYAHFQSNKETTVRTCCVFSLCMFPTLQMAVSIRHNSDDCEKFVLWQGLGFHLTAPYTTCFLVQLLS